MTIFNSYVSLPEGNIRNIPCPEHPIPISECLELSGSKSLVMAVVLNSRRLGHQRYWAILSYPVLGRPAKSLAAEALKNLAVDG